MRLTKNDIPYLLDFVGYKDPQEPGKIQEWLNLYNNNPFSMFHIYITQHCEQEPNGLQIFRYGRRLKQKSKL